MKSFSKVFAFLLAFFMLAGSVAQAQDKPKGWSRKAKCAAIGGAGGAVLGGLVGRKQDKKKDPVRYNRYRNN